MNENRTAKIDGPMTFGYGIDATDSACKINGAEQTSASHAKGPAVTMMIIVTLGLEKISTEGDSL